LGVAGKCRVCGAPAYARLEYANLQLCRDDFIRFFERRVKRTIERYGMFERGSRVAVAVSGGKDSVALLHSLWKLRMKLGVELVAITIDLGIAGHSDRYVPISPGGLREAGRPVQGRRPAGGVRVLGGRAEGVAQARVLPVRRREAVRAEQGGEGAGGPRTGDRPQPRRLPSGPPPSVHKGGLASASEAEALPAWEGKLVAKAKPLVETPEKDTKLYVQALGLEHVTWKCPYSSGASSFEYKRVLDLLEGEHPSIKFQMLRSFLERIQPLISVEEPSLVSCSKCGEPSSSPVCQFCRIKSRIAKLETNSAKRGSPHLEGAGRVSNKQLLH